MTGLYGKFNVSRVDGRDSAGGDKEGARYFVLDPLNDQHARVALLNYAASCYIEEPELAKDLIDWLEELNG